MHDIDAELAAVIDRLRRLRAEVQQALRASDRGGLADVQRESSASGAAAAAALRAPGGRQADTTTST